MIDDAVDFVTCGQSGGFMMFNTSDGNEVCEGIANRVTKARKLKTLPEQFDSLLALTFALDHFDYWLNDNECYERGGALEKGLKSLAKAWKALLANPDTSIGIDPEYTRAGVVALLEGLEKKANEEPREEGDGTYQFKWR